jgi:hypothetical protein
VKNEIKNLRRKILLKIDAVEEYDELHKLKPACISTNVQPRLTKYEILLKSTSKKHGMAKQPFHAIVSFDYATLNVL